MSLSEARGYLIAYDIADPRRWRRVHRAVRAVALPLQYSLYYAPRLTWRQLTALEDRLREIVSAQQDDVRIYPLAEEPVFYCYGRMPVEVGAGLLLGYGARWQPLESEVEKGLES